MPFFCESRPILTLFEVMNAISIPEKNAEKTIETKVIIKAVEKSIIYLFVLAMPERSSSIGNIPEGLLIWYEVILSFDLKP